MQNELKDLLKSSYVDAEDLELLFIELAPASGIMTIIIDGLDECEKTERLVVLKVLGRLSSSGSLVKVFFSSRDHMMKDIASIFDTCLQISMGCKDAHADIATYVNEIVAEKLESMELQIGGTELIQQVRKALIGEANGM